MPVHELLLSNTEEARNNEVDVYRGRNRDVNDRKDQGEDLLHLLHLWIRLLRRRVAAGELLHLEVLQTDRQEDEEDVRRLAAPAQTMCLNGVGEVQAERAKRSLG